MVFDLGNYCFAYFIHIIMYTRYKKKKTSICWSYYEKQKVQYYPIDNPGEDSWKT